MSLDSTGSRKLLVLDTGPIRELITYRAVHDLGFDRLRPELRYLTNAEAYERCGTYLSSFHRKTTSASVVAELNCWIRDTPPLGRRQLWQLAREEFTAMGMDEELVRFLDLEIDFVARYGPIDTSLLEIARRNLSQDPILLTLDGQLYGECWNSRISSKLLTEICDPVA